MIDKIQSIKNNFEDNGQKALSHLEIELSKIRAGRANSALLDDIKVEYYGAFTPLNQVANVNALDARTLIILPWEKKMLPLIEKAIMAANIGITPQNDGQQIRLHFPLLTEERRKELSKKVAAEGEHGKVSIRNHRRDTIENLKKLQKEGLSEDQMNSAELSIQGLTDKYIQQIDKLIAAKEKEIMHV
ncbi:MAG: ribosome recycling factor [Sediminibacterium sp.]|nr:ribosome recycling factor [Sediminibacterium sp.]